MSTNKKHMRNIVIAVTVFFLAGMSSIIVIQHIQLEKVRFQWTVKKKKMENLKAEIQVVDGWIKEFETERSKFSSKLFSDSDIPGFLEEITQCTKTHGLSAVDIKKGKFSPLRIPKGNKEVFNANEVGKKPGSVDFEFSESVYVVFMPIEILFKGNFASVVNFMKCLQNHSRLLSVSNMKLQPTKQYPLLEGQVTIHIYSLKTTSQENKK